jgi:hypothetical protein
MIRVDAQKGADAGEGRAGVGDEVVEDHHVDVSPAEQLLVGGDLLGEAERGPVGAWGKAGRRTPSLSLVVEGEGAREVSLR